MKNISINMTRSKSTKRFDVFEADRPDAVVTTIYVNKAAEAPEKITIMLQEFVP